MAIAGKIITGLIGTAAIGIVGLCGIESAARSRADMLLEEEEKAKFAKAHKPHNGDDICHKCKCSCGEPTASQDGYGSREGTIKHTYYCSNCGRYFNVWR